MSAPAPRDEPATPDRRMPAAAGSADRWRGADRPFRASPGIIITTSAGGVVNTLVEFAIRLANLAEAEGRTAKRHGIQIVMASLTWAAAMLFLVAGVIVVALAIYFALVQVMPSPLALLLVAALLFGAGAAGTLLGKAILNGRRHRGGEGGM